MLSTADLGLSPDPLNPLNDVSTMNKTMEYMAFEVPVVAFDLKETRVSAGDAAVYVEPNDVAAYARAIGELLDDPDRRRRMGNEGRQRVVDVLAWRHQAPRYVDAYERVCDEPHRGAPGGARFATRAPTRLRRPATQSQSDEGTPLTASVAFVTPSYRLDLERCALLNRSLEACATSFEHWIIVDRGDLPLFRSLQSNRTNVVAKEEVLPVWVHRVDTLKLGLRSNIWLQARGRPIRGWLLQQLVKLAVAKSLSVDVVVHADSDVVLLRPFSADLVVDVNGRVRLFERPDYVDETLPDHIRWHRSAERLLELAPIDLPMPDYISTLVPWKRENAVALLHHLEKTTGRHWLRAVAAAWDVSEYVLYGRFVRDVLGARGGQFVSPSPLCLDYYKRVPLTVAELTTFLDGVDEETVAVSLTAKAGMNPEDYIQLLERRWALADAR